MKWSVAWKSSLKTITRLVEIVLITARELAETLVTNTDYQEERKVCPRKVKLFFDYESTDEPVISPGDSVKVNFMIVLDAAINSLSQRF